MHQRLSKSPITYVLAQVQFSDIANIADYIPKLQDEIRPLFPLYQMVNIQTIQFRDGQQPPVASVSSQWQFMDKDKRTGIVLDSRSVSIHTSGYETFATLLKSLEKTLALFNKILKIALFTRIGLRYINFMDNNVDKVNSELRGFKLKNNDFMDDRFLTKTETTQMSRFGTIKVQATHIGNREIVSGIKNIFVPPDLADIANFLLFEHRKLPDKGFLILDIDQFNAQQGNFDVSSISNRFQELHEVIYSAFRNAIGEEVLKDLE